MNNIKKITASMILLVLLSLVACGIEDKTNVPTEQLPSKFVDYEALGIEAYDYPAEFSMGDNLKTAITQLALCYECFDKDAVGDDMWKELFVARFIQNSRLSFDYLDMISEQNKGEIGIDELNYIQYSLTNIALDFSSDIDGTVNRYDASSALTHGQISRWDYADTDDGVVMTADLEVEWDGTKVTRKRELTVHLVQNPYSCFDGYSVVSISSKDIISTLEQERGLHVFHGIDMMEEDYGVFPFEFLHAEDDLEYGHFVYVDLTQLPELADYVRQNAGNEFKVTFMINGDETSPIVNVVPFDLILEE